MKKASGSLMLLLTALIWGLAFVVQRSGMSIIGPYTFQAVRTLLASAALLPLALLRRQQMGPAWRMPPVELWLSCGLLVGGACLAQQVGLTTTPAGKAGFISSLYVVLVPIFALFTGRRAGWGVWLGVTLAVAGLYMLSAVGSFSLDSGEGLMLVCAALSAAQILLVDRYAAPYDGVMLSCLQFLVAGLLPVPLAIFLERPALADVWQAKWLILYAGVMSSAVGYTLQILGQKRVPPALASILLCLESVFAAAAGALILGERMTGRELAGCALMLSAVVLAQLPEKNGENTHEISA